MRLNEVYFMSVFVRNMEFRQGEEFPIYKDPSASEIFKLFRTSKVLRGFSWRNTAYVWESKILHHSVINAMQLQNVGIQDYDYRFYLTKDKPTIRKKRDEELRTLDSIGDHAIEKMLRPFPDAMIWEDRTDPYTLDIWINA